MYTHMGKQEDYIYKLITLRGKHQPNYRPLPDTHIHIFDMSINEDTPHQANDTILR